MRRYLFYIVSAISFFSIILTLMCGDIPSNPFKDPNNVNVSFMVMNNSSGINYQDQPVEMGIIIRYPNLVTRVRVVYPDSLKNDTLYSDALPNATFDTVISMRTFKSTGKKEINVFVDLNSGTVKEFTFNPEIIQKHLSVFFDTVPPSVDTIITGKPYTMKFSALTDPAGGAIVFSAKSLPVLDSLHLNIVSTGTMALVIATPSADTVYNITVTAKSGTASKDSTVTLISRPQIKLQEMSSVATMQSGSSDTLLFTAGGTKPGSVSSILILNISAFKSGEIVPVNKGADTLCFIFTPADAKIYTFTAEVVTTTRKDTVTYDISVSKETMFLLRQDTVTIIVTEGETLSISLVPYLIDTTAELSANKGTVSDKSLSYIVPAGKLKDTVIVDISKNSNVSKLQIFLDINKSDVPKFTVAYAGNGNTSGTAPVDTNHYPAGASVKTADPGSLVKTGYVFTGWNTATDGNGMAHAAGTSYAIGAANDTLYAQWTINPTYTVTYIGNGNTDGSVPVDANHYEAGTTVITAANSSLVKTGYIFTGWNTSAAGNGTARSAETSYAIGAADDTLYAQWTIRQYTITYLDNGSTAGTVPKDTVHYDSGSTVIVCANSGVLTKTGFEFTGWNTAENGSGISFAANNETFIITSNVILYANWKGKTYKLTYNGNTNTDGTVPQEETYDSNSVAIVAANNGNLSKTGFDFIGWNTMDDYSGTHFNAGAKLTITENTTLYAEWKTKQYYLTMTRPLNGTVNISGYVTVDSGSATTIIATAASGYRFKNWTVVSGSAAIDNQASANTTVKLTQGDATIRAVFGCLTFEKEVDQQATCQSFSVTQWDDGSFYIAGQNTMIYKFDTIGNFVWEKTYGTISELRSIQKTADGFILAGTDLESKINLLKIVPNGNEIFSYSFFTGAGYFAQQTDDGNFIVGGANMAIFYPFLFKTNENSLVTWVDSNTFGDTEGYRIYDGQQTSDEGFVFVGADMRDLLYVVKKTSIGVETWHKYFEDISGARSIRQTSDGGYITGGSSGVSKCTLLRLNSTGDEVWRSENTNAESIISIRQTSDGGFVYAGKTRIIGEGGYDFYLTRTNSSGTILWTHTFGTAGADEIATGMELTKDGGFIIVGSSGTDSNKLYIVKTDENGNVDQ